MSDTKMPVQITSVDTLGPLPDLFRFNDGRRVATREDWERRRGELYDTAITLQYGTMPPPPEVFSVDLLNEAYDTVVSCRIEAGTGERTASFLMTVIKPAGMGPFPAAVDGDMCFGYPFDRAFTGAFTDNGMMLVLFNRTELAHDRNNAREGQLYEVYPELDFGAVGAWGWGYSRCVDALEQLGIADMGCIAFTGHSRGGKTAALAGALDTRATIVNPNDACAGACGCYRTHMTAIDEKGQPNRSETLEDLVTRYPFWMGPGLKAYGGREAELPFDTHYLKALIAPRVLLQTEAVSDIWSNPVGAMRSSLAAREVFGFLGVPENILWHWRSGFHYHDVRDVTLLVQVMRHYREGTPLPETVGQYPFALPEPGFDWRAPTGSVLG